MNNSTININADEDSSKNLSMKWYNALIYAILFLSALYCAYNAMLMFTGKLYGDTEYKEIVYGRFPSLKIIDITMALALIIIAIGCIITRQALKNYAKIGPTFLTAIYVVNILLSLLYVALVSLTTKMSIKDIIDESFFRTLGQSCVMIAVNKTYFSKRKHMFVNELKLI